MYDDEDFDARDLDAAEELAELRAERERNRFDDREFDDGAMSLWGGR